MNGKRLLILVSSALWLTNCALQDHSFLIADDYAEKRGCDRKDVDVSYDGLNEYGANGCGRHTAVTYKCKTRRGKVRCVTPEISPHFCQREYLEPLAQKLPPRYATTFKNQCTLDYCDTPSASKCIYYAAYGSNLLDTYQSGNLFEMLIRYGAWVDELSSLTLEVWRRSISTGYDAGDTITMGMAIVHELNKDTRRAWHDKISAMIKVHPNEKERAQLVEIWVNLREHDELAWRPTGSFDSYGEAISETRSQISKSITRYEVIREMQK